MWNSIVSVLDHCLFIYFSTGLSLLVFGAGCGIRLYRFLIIAFLSTFLRDCLFWCLGQDVEFDCIGSWSLPFYLLFYGIVSFGVWGRMWNSIVSVLDHCLFIYFSTGLSLLVFGAGCGIRLYRFLIIAFLSTILRDCLFWCLGQDVEFDCIGSWSLPFYLLFYGIVSFGVWGRMWNSIVSVLDHCLFIYFSTGLSLLVFGAGCGIRLYRFLIIAFLSTFLRDCLFWCLGQDVEFDCIGSWSLPFYLLFYGIVSFGVWGRMWNSIVSVLDHCLFIYFSTGYAKPVRVQKH